MFSWEHAGWVIKFAIASNNFTFSNETNHRHFWKFKLVLRPKEKGLSIRDTQIDKIWAKVIRKIFESNREEVVGLLRQPYNR
jgi:hypothetical protein